jgi:hypothetical protein
MDAKEERGREEGKVDEKDGKRKEGCKGRKDEKEGRKEG